MCKDSLQYFQFIRHVKDRIVVTTTNAVKYCIQYSVMNLIAELPKFSHFVATGINETKCKLLILQSAFLELMDTSTHVRVRWASDMNSSKLVNPVSCGAQTTLCIGVGYSLSNGIQ